VVARRYLELDCWQLSNELKLRVYAFIANPPASRDFEFRDQIRRSARGAPRTIAEGFGRFRPKEFARYQDVQDVVRYKEPRNPEPGNQEPENQERTLNSAP
jgi:23S rRNA-intervening sequence protein